MKELLQQYAAYNIWATKTLFERISKLPEEKITQEIVSSFPSIYKTAVHLWQAESIWWQRTQKAETIMILSEVFEGNFSELTNGLAAQSQQWKSWVDDLEESELESEFSFIRNKEPHTIKVKDMLLHLFNHGTFHRGQLVTFLRQLNESEIPSTDFVIFSRLVK